MPAYIEEMGFDFPTCVDMGGLIESFGADSYPDYALVDGGAFAHGLLRPGGAGVGGRRQGPVGVRAVLAGQGAAGQDREQETGGERADGASPVDGAHCWASSRSTAASTFSKGDCLRSA